MTTSKVTHGIIDASGETSTTTFWLEQLTGANFDTVAGNGAGDNVGKLRLAVATITLGNFTKHSVQGIVYAELGTLPADQFAQRELKAFFSCVDDVTAKRFNFTIPCPDLAAIATPGTDVLDLTGNAVLASLVTEVEANAVSEAGNTFTMLSGRIVGRNN